MIGKSVLGAAIVIAALSAACGGAGRGEAVSGTPDTSTDGGTSTTSDGGSSTGPSVEGLPCDVGQVIAAKCGACHGAAGATAPTLSTYAEVSAASARVVARMKDSANPMPPAYAGNPASAAEIAAVEAWVNAGKPTGTCATATDAGAPVPVPTTCASGVSWTRGNRGSDDMKPGLACLACHATTGGEGPMRRYMGTAYPSLHEKDNCNAKPTGTVTVEILDANGAVVETIRVSAVSGNFASARSGSAIRYRARVKVDGVVKSEMQSFQTNGDCNACHTEQGTGGAPGRVVY